MHWLRPFIVGIDTASASGHTRAEGRCEFANKTGGSRGALPTQRTDVDDVVTRTDHQFAFLDIDLQLHRPIGQSCQRACVPL